MDSWYQHLPAEGQIDANACWAACLRWWLFAAKSIFEDQQNLLMKYDSGEDGTINEKVMRQIIEDTQWGMTKEIFRSATNFTAKALQKHLAHGPVYVGYTESGTRKKHVNVIYAMETSGGITKVAVMEPQTGKEKPDCSFEGKHMVKSLRDFNRLGSVYVGSLKPR